MASSGTPAEKHGLEGRHLAGLTSSEDFHTQNQQAPQTCEGPGKTLTNMGEAKEEAEAFRKPRV